MSFLRTAWHWLLAFVDANEWQIVGTISLLLVMLRGVPAARWAKLERDWPRVANTVRFFRALFPDVVKALRALAAVWTGARWATVLLALLDRVTSEPDAPKPPRVPPMPMLLTLGVLLTGCGPLTPVPLVASLLALGALVVCCSSATLRIGRLIAPLAVIALATSCSPATRRRDDACRAGDTRCTALDGGTYAETCLQGEGRGTHWVHLADRPCEPRGGVCCWTSSATSTRQFYACTTPETCLPEPTTATVAPAATDGGAP